MDFLFFSQLSDRSVSLHQHRARLCSDLARVGSDSLFWSFASRNLNIFGAKACVILGERVSNSMRKPAHYLNGPLTAIYLWNFNFNRQNPDFFLLYTISIRLFNCRTHNQLTWNSPKNIRMSVKTALKHISDV